MSERCSVRALEFNSVILGTFLLIVSARCSSYNLGSWNYNIRSIVFFFFQIFYLNFQLPLLEAKSQVPVPKKREYFNYLSATVSCCYFTFKCLSPANQKATANQWTSPSSKWKLKGQGRETERKCTEVSLCAGQWIFIKLKNALN